MGSRMTYTEEDKKWLQDEIEKLKANGNFNFPGLRNANFLEKYYNRFNKRMAIEGIMTLLKRIDNPELMKEQYKKYKEAEKLRKQGLLPRKGRTSAAQNIADILSKNPIIIVIGDKVAGYENEDQAKQAIIDSQVPIDMIKMFEVKERKIKSQLIVDIE